MINKRVCVLPFTRSPANSQNGNKCIDFIIKIRKQKMREGLNPGTIGGAAGLFTDD